MPERGTGPVTGVRAGAWLVVAGALWLVACGEAGPTPVASPHVRLWELPAAWTTAPPSAPVAPIEVRYATRFDGHATGGDTPAPTGPDAGAPRPVWRRARRVQAAGVAGFVFDADAPAGGALRLDPTEGWGWMIELPVRAGEALAVRLRARGLGQLPDGDLPVAWLVERREAFDPTLRLLPDDIHDLRDPRRFASHELAGRLAADERELTAEFMVEPLTHYLDIFLLAPIARPGLVVEVTSLSVERWPLAALTVVDGALPRVERLPAPGHDAASASHEGPGPARLALDREERAGLLLVPGASWRFEVPSGGAGAARFGAALGAPDRDPALSGALHVEIRAGTSDGSHGPAHDWELVRDWDLVSPPGPAVAAWDDFEFPLPDTGGAPLVVEVHCSGRGVDPPFGLLAHPTVSWQRTDPPPNVVLISLDTLRPDRLGCYGGDPSLSPRIDALAAEGLRFAHAYSTSSYTLPSHGSLLTGQYPAVHGAVGINDRLDPSRSPFLARILAQAGYDTAAFTGGGYVSPDYGFAEGFDRYSINDPVWALEGVRGKQLLATMGWERAPMSAELLARYDAAHVARWIRERGPGRPFFVFLHTYVVHNYAPDREALARHGLLAADGTEAPLRHVDREAFNRGEDVPRAKVVAEYLPYYDATVGMADGFVGTVLDALAAAGLERDTLVIVTADHGEEFGEHGFFGHGETLFEQAVRVPLVARLPERVGPGVTRRAGVAEEPASLVDVAPWILRVAGLPPEPRMFPGAPLGPARDDPPGRRRLVMELDTHLRRVSAVRDGDLKLELLLSGDSRDLVPGVPRLSDLDADPDERIDLAPTRPDDTERLLEALKRFHEFTGAIRPRGGASAPDLSKLPPELRAQLQALGYIGGGDDGTGGAGTGDGGTVPVAPPGSGKPAGDGKGR